MTRKGSKSGEDGSRRHASGSVAAVAKHIHLRLLNGFSLSTSAGEPLPLRGSRAQCIVAYLALQPMHSCTRQALMGLLWSDRGQAQAQASLRMSLSEIRAGFRQTAYDVLIADRDEVELKSDLVAIDCLDMVRLATEPSIVPNDT